MAVSVAYNPELGVIESIFKGFVYDNDLQEAATQAISLGRELGVRRFLCDAQDGELNASIMDIFNIPNKLYDKENADRLGRLAVIMPKSKKSREAAMFFETVCQNRGWNTKVFPNRQKALDWLNESS